MIFLGLVTFMSIYFFEGIVSRIKKQMNKNEEIGAQPLDMALK